MCQFFVFGYLPTRSKRASLIWKLRFKNLWPVGMLGQFGHRKIQRRAAMLPLPSCAAFDQPRPSFTQRRLHQLQTCPHPLRSPTPSAPAWAWGVLPAWGPLWVCWTSPVSGWWFKICVMFIPHAFNQSWRHQSLDYCDIIFPSLWDKFPWYHHPCWLQPP